MNYTELLKVPQEDSYNRNITLVSNEVDDPSYWGGDGGAIHTLSQCTDCVLDGNYFHSQRHGTKCTVLGFDLSSGLCTRSRVRADLPHLLLNSCLRVLELYLNQPPYVRAGVPTG
jgi:hypothetical protein